MITSPLRARRKGWVTLESGTHVNLEGSRVTAGPPALKGKPLPAHKEASDKLAASRAGGKGPESSASPPSGEARKSKAKVAMDDNSPAANQNWKDLAGGVPTQEIASMVGAPDDAAMDVYMGKGSALIDVDHPSYTAERIVGKDENGDTYIKNSKFFLKEGKEKGTGLGSRVFSDQVANLSATAETTGIKYIACSAARDLGSGKQANGYYTWPRMGYDQSLSDYTDATPSEKQTLETAAKKFNASSVLDVMATQEGRDWWKTNGCDLRNMKFDLAKGSRSMKVHTAYLEERKTRGDGARTKSLTGREDGRSGIEEIELSDDDEAALDAAWDKMEGSEKSKRFTASVRKDWREDQHPRVQKRLKKSAFNEQDHPRADDGKFGVGGTAKPQHGEQAARLAGAGQKLRESMAAHKEERKAAFGELKQQAHAANDRANEHAGKLQESVDNIAWIAENDGDAHGDLESAIGNYDETGTTAERMEALKDIDAEAKACLVADGQVLEAPGIEGVTEADKAANKQHLAEIISNAKQARAALRDHVRHRREMAAIKRGEAKGLRGTITKAFREDEHPRADDGKVGKLMGE